VTQLELVDTEVIMLAGGFGTRSANPNLPKLLQEVVSGKSLLELNINSFRQLGIDKFRLVLGHASDLVISFLAENQKIFENCTLQVLLEKEPLGTTSAALMGAKGSKSEHLILSFGDVLIVGHLDKSFRRWLESGLNFGTLVHPNLHPHDSDLVSFDKEGIIRGFKPKGNPKIKTSWQTLPLAGLLFARREALLGLEKSSQTDLSASLASEEGQCLAIPSSIYLKDSGTPLRLKEVRQDFLSGTAARRGTQNRGAIFLDRDGTLMVDAPTGRTSVASNEIHPKTSKAISRINRAGIPIFLVTNQPAVAKGQILLQDVYRAHNELIDALAEHGAFLDDIVFCPHHPEEGHPGELLNLKVRCGCRKPQAGMIDELSRLHHFSVEDSYVIGDSEADERLANNLSCNFISVAHLYGQEAPDISAQLMEALEGILSLVDN
jgi:mannose-1-phosphate guanylyltransferase / phosphomannomutase